MFMDYIFGRNTGIWAESSEKWDETHPSWKIVGHDPRRLPKNEVYFTNMSQEIFHKSSIEHIFDHDRARYLVVFSSGRTCVASSSIQVEAGSFVIIEADRGEDCAQVREKIDICGGEEKVILRKATSRDIKILEQRKIQEEKALEKCNALVQEKGLLMEITNCEFQWDMKKITFYFKSDRRVDFRELVRDLFKYFKIRIWMSMENRR